MDYADLDLYKVFGLGPETAQIKIGPQYRKLALLRHPDKNRGRADAEEAFKQLNHANTILGNPEKRKEYDLNLKEKLEAQGKAVPHFFTLGNRAKPAGPPRTHGQSGSYANKPRPDPRNHHYGSYYGGGSSQKPSTGGRQRRTETHYGPESSSSRRRPSPEPPRPKRQHTGRHRHETHYAPPSRTPSPEPHFGRRRAETHYAPPSRTPSPDPQFGQVTVQEFRHLLASGEFEVGNLLNTINEIQRELLNLQFIFRAHYTGREVATEVNAMQVVLWDVHKLFRKQLVEIDRLPQHLAFARGLAQALDRSIAEHRRAIGPWRQMLNELHRITKSRQDVDTMGQMIAAAVEGWREDVSLAWKVPDIRWSEYVR